ncbi:MmgE/PrpD family protein [Salinigranum marinum]|jgi:2-methylcitrate dehydratase|uniref:MmgE/PrpD family protein n=1 Tax=Salinigranum marinum TaxID=1515595 RepID=UPI002989CDBE|nr:MmgE/PrpD family protein [Salinigranum marinum]
MEFTSDVITEYAHGLSIDDISAEAIDAAKRLVLDSVGCCLGAYTSPPSKHLRGTYGRLDGPDGRTATVFGAGTETLVEYAGLINATQVRYLDYNDTYISEGRACHPSDHIPALISVAEAEGRTGAELVEAIVLAYEIEGAGVDTGVLWGNDYDYVTWGAFSGAVAVGKLMGLDYEQIRNAVGIAGASNLTLMISRKGDVSMWKGAAHPYVTHNAIQACQMARAGLTGPERVFEGPGGFFEVVADRRLEIDRLGGRDGAAYRITDAHVKPFPCGYYMQPMVAGVRDLVADHDVAHDAIEEIRIETFDEAASILGGAEKWSADLTRESADHSIPYTAAIAAIYGDVEPKHYGQAYRSDPTVHRLMQLVSVTETDAMNAEAVRNPDSTPSIVRLVADGATYETHVDYAPGHAQNPMSQADLEAKMRSMAEPLLTDEQVETLVDSCGRLETLSTVDSLVDALTI